MQRWGPGVEGLSGTGATDCRRDFDLGRDFRSLRTTPADNLLAVKLSYWLGL
jgi:hypothetical protein